MIVHSRDYGDVSVPDTLLDDLASYYGVAHREVIDRLEAYSRADRAAAWAKQSPQSEADMRAFYEQHDYYVWQLVLFNCSDLYEPHLRAMTSAVQHLAIGESGCCLDYGCGIGSAAILASERGLAITIADIPGPTLDFARHRLHRRGIHHECVEIKTALPRLTGSYDLVICIDVLEHVCDPSAILRLITSHLRPGGIAHLSVAFLCQDDDHPDHIASHADRYREPYWSLETSASGLDPVDVFVYRKVSTRGSVLRKLRYGLWSHTGLYISTIPRPKARMNGPR